MDLACGPQIDAAHFRILLDLDSVSPFLATNMEEGKVTRRKRFLEKIRWHATH